MAIPNYEKYAITRHAQEKLIDRFNLAKSDVTSWIKRFMTQAQFQETQPDNRQKWRKGDIVMIIDTKQKTIVTVFNKSADDEIVGSSPLNPELASGIKNYINEYVSKKKRRLGLEVADSALKLSEVSSKMKDQRTNFRYSDALYLKLMESFNEIENKVKKTNILIKEAETFADNKLKN